MIPIIETSIWSAITHLGALILAFILDKFMHPEISNLISLVLSAVINFFFQKRVLAKDKTLDPQIIEKYITVSVVNNIIQQALFMVWYRHVKHRYKYTTTKIRLILSVAGYFLIAYPGRKYWAFK